MTVYYSDDSVTLYHGDCIAVLATLPAASVDAVVCDPPYGLEFMGVAWDTMRDGGTPRARNEWGDFGSREHARHPSEVAAINRRKGIAFGEFSYRWAVEALRVLKPGGHMLAFGGTRTYHRLACAVEDAGFEIRDSMSWLYGSGFPKSLNVGDGRGTALKPAHEPIVVARKPLAGTVAGNVAVHGTGALNIDGCRVAHASAADLATSQAKNPGRSDSVTSGVYGADRPQQSVNAAGRWPTNVLLDQSQADALDAESGECGSTLKRAYGGHGRATFDSSLTGEVFGYGDSGGASRFFPTFRYEAKAPQAERPRDGATVHPTVKPLDLMRWLVRLVTPRGGLVLDPFLGSGTTAEACVLEGLRCIGIEREADYLPLTVARLSKPLQVGFDFGASA